MPDRTLIIMRHAKSSWKNTLLSDHERPLNRRGHKSADHLGHQLADELLSPQLVVASDSTRTTETWHGMWPHLPHTEVIFRRDFYLGGLPDIQRALDALPREYQRVLVLGHNPGFSLAAAWLSGVHVELKTAYAAVLDGHGAEWSDVHQPGAWRLRHILTPDVTS